MDVQIFILRTFKIKNIWSEKSSCKLKLCITFDLPARFLWFLHRSKALTETFRSVQRSLKPGHEIESYRPFKLVYLFLPVGKTKKTYKIKTLFTMHNTPSGPLQCSVHLKSSPHMRGMIWKNVPFDYSVSILTYFEFALN